MKSMEVRLEWRNGQKTAFGSAAQSLLDFARLAVGEKRELRHISIDVRANTLILFMEESNGRTEREG